MLRSFIRRQSTLTSKSTGTAIPATPVVQQAPNRVGTWTQSQETRSNAINHPKFLQKDLSKQPQPYAAIDLISKEPVRFINDRIAACQGNKQAGQGHPRVFINLDAKKVGTCGYCGLRYAQEAFKGDIDV